jgi:hypothetical protein
MVKIKMQKKLKAITELRVTKHNFDSIQWKQASIGSRSGTIEGVAVSFSKKSKAVDIFNCVRVFISQKVLDELGWKTGDKIVPFYDPDHIMSRKFVKTETGRGVTLVKGATSGAAYLQMTWDEKVPLSKMPCAEHEYVVYKKQLMLTFQN